MTSRPTCAHPGCDKPVRPVPRARYCSWEHLTDAMNRRERIARARKRAADRVRAQRQPAAPKAAPAAPLPPRAFTDDPRAELDYGSPGRTLPPPPVHHGLGVSSLVGM